MGNSTSNVHVVIVGAGYGGITIAKALDGKVKVTLIEPRDTLNHKVASLRAAVVPGWEKRARIPYTKLLKNGKIVSGEVDRVSEGKVHLKDGSVISGDYIVLAHGYGRSTFPCDFADDTLDSSAYMSKLRTKQQQIRDARSILIIGGGPVGCELAGEIGAEHPGKKITLVQSSHHVLNNSVLPLPDKVYEKTEKKLQQIGVTLKLNNRVTNMPSLEGNDSFIYTKNQARTYTLQDGSSVDADMVILCTGFVRPRGNLVDAVDSENRVRVNAALQVEGFQRVFCIGDANDVKETKLAGLAAQQAEHVAKQILKQASAGEGKQPPALEPYVLFMGQKEFGLMFVPIGPKMGVGAFGKTVLGDRMVSLAKGKGLLTKKTFGSMNATVPAL